MSHLYKRSYNGPLKAIIFDWAGTTMDYGCLSPASPFIETFKLFNLDISMSEARGPMGMFKRDHIKTILNMPRIKKQWNEFYKRDLTEKDIDNIFETYLPLQFEVLANFKKLIPGAKETVDHARKMGLKIGSTTGYSREMIKILLPLATEQGYCPDNVICMDEVPAGRPSPWMAVMSAMKLGVYPFSSIVKVGDTVVDIEEGLNAGMWTVALAKCGNEMGLSESEVNALSPIEYDIRLNRAYNTLSKAGAHFVIDSISDLPTIIDEINRRLQKGECP